MGTGVLGGGGGGGGSGAGIRAGLGACTSAGGILQSRAPQPSEVDSFIRSTLERLPKEYILKYFKSPVLQGVYSSLFGLAIDLGQNRSWTGIERAYGVKPDAGCLRHLAMAVLNQYGTELDERVAGVARGALEDFLMQTVGNDPAVFVNGDAEAVLRSVRPETFRSTSGYFLTFLLQRILTRESGRMPDDARRASREGSERLANQIVASFANERKSKGEVRYSELIETLAADPPWFRAAVKQ